MDSADDGGAKVCKLVAGAGGRGGSVCVSLSSILDSDLRESRKFVFSIF